MPAESYKALPSTDLLAQSIAVDIGLDGLEYQLEQPVFGPDGGAKILVDDVDGARFPLGGAQLGIRAETAAASDTASSGLIGRLKRIAQNVSAVLTLLAGGVKQSSINIPATIPNGAHFSTPFPLDIRGRSWIGYQLPPEFDGATLVPSVSVDGISFFFLYGPTGLPITVQQTPNSQSFVVPEEFQNWSYLLLGSVNQTGDTVIQLQGTSRS